MSNDMKRHVFLDCGGHIGESIDRFRASDLYRPYYEIHSFEPLPNSAEKCKEKKDIHFHQKAVWIEDGVADFYSDDKQITWGSTLIESKNTSVLNKSNPLTVETIDFSKWVTENFSKDDYIILKMDIEGAEYKVLRKMFEDGTINYIDKLYIEWHCDRIDIAKEEHIALIKTLRSIPTLEVLPEMMKVL